MTAAILGTTTGPNSSGRAAARLREWRSQKYAEKYGEAKFTPQAVQDAVRHLERTKTSIVQDKVATPPEPAKIIEDWHTTLCPHYIVAERSTRAQANIAENYKSVFARFGDFNAQTGTEMTNQHNALYLGHGFSVHYAVRSWRIRRRAPTPLASTRDGGSPNASRDLARLARTVSGLSPTEIIAFPLCNGASVQSEVV